MPGFFDLLISARTALGRALWRGHRYVRPFLRLAFLRGWGWFRTLTERGRSQYEGTVNQVMGDGIMALFGAPVAHKDHAVRACYAALDMQVAMSRHAEEVRRLHGISLDIRIGLNSGEVVVRAIGNDLHMDYTAIGQTTHLAARMEQLARPGSAFLTADTLRLAEGYIAVKSLGPVPVKGLDAPIEIYEMIGAGPMRSRLHAAATRGLTKLVGRQNELEQLRHALARAARGQGQVVAIVGEPGVGKSRLVWEVTHSHRTHGWLVLQGGSVSYGKATMYLPVVDLLKDYFKIDDRDEQRDVRERIVGKVIALDDVLKPTLPALLALFDVPIEDPQWAALDPSQRRQRTIDAVKQLLLRESHVQPLLVVVEDLHWIDGETQALLDSLVESLPTTRLTLLVNYRPEYRHGWGSKTYYSQLSIDPLTPGSADELLQAILGPDLSLQPLKTLLIQRTQGNPFFLEESVRTLVETQFLTGQRGAFRLVRPLGAIQVPATVQAVLSARIDRLPVEDKRLLQAAAVVGKDVPFSLLQEIAGVSDAELRPRLAALQSAEFLYETQLLPNLEYTFKHALTHEVAYGSLVHERRRDVHAQIVVGIERLYPDRVLEQVERLAHHSVRGEVWGKALRYLRQAAAKAHSRSAYREAAEQLKQALMVLGHASDTRDRTEQAFDIRLELRAALFPLGEVDQLSGHLTEAGHLAETLGDPLRIAMADGFMGNVLWWTGQPERALEHYQRAHDRASRLRDGHEVGWKFGVGQAYHALGEYHRAIEPLSDAARLLSGDRLRWRSTGGGGFAAVFTRCWLAWCLGERGDFGAAQGWVEDAVAIAEELNHPFSLVYGYCERGRLALMLGDTVRAVPPLERALEVGRHARLPIWFPWVAATLGRAYSRCGRTQEGLALLEQGIRQAETTRFMFGQGLRVAWRAEAYLHAGHTEEMADLAQRALELCRACRERGHEAWALLTVGEVAAHLNSTRIETAEGSYRAAMALAEELGMRPLVAHCHLGLGKLQSRSGDRAKADGHLATAIAMYREMGMRFWLQQAEAERGASA